MLVSHKNITKLSLIAILLIVIYYPSFSRLVTIWNTKGDYSHGYLIFPIAAFLVWRKWEKLVSLPRGSSSGGLALLLFASLCCIGGTFSRIDTAVYISFPLFLAGLSLVLWGVPATRELLFPLVFLVFMFPIPSVFYSQVTSPLQLISSKGAASLLNVIGIQVWREGNVILLPNMTMEVATACSGLRSLISLMALGAVFAYIFQPTVARSVILFLTTVPLAISANLLRITVTGICSHLYGREAAEGFYHEFSGLLVFIFSLVFLAIFGSLIRWIGRNDIGS